MKKLFLFGVLFLGLFFGGRVFSEALFYKHSYVDRKIIRTRILPNTNLNKGLRDYLEVFGEYENLKKQISKKELLVVAGASGKKSKRLDLVALRELLLHLTDELRMEALELMRYLIRNRIEYISIVEKDFSVDRERQDGEIVLVENEKILQRFTRESLKQKAEEYKRENEELNKLIQQNNDDDSMEPFFPMCDDDDAEFSDINSPVDAENEVDFDAIMGSSLSGSSMDDF